MRSTDPAVRRTRVGLLAASLAFFLWGLFPLYWQYTDHVGDVEVTLHRVLWSAVLAWAIVLLTRRGRRRAGSSGAARRANQPRPPAPDRAGIAPVATAAPPHPVPLPAATPLIPRGRALWPLVGGGILISFNWLTYIFAVTGGLSLDASLGYYINPLLSIFIGMLAFGERLSRLQWVALALAGLGVAWLTVRLGTFPWIAVVLAGSFGTYGVVKKLTRLAPIHSLSVELIVPGMVALVAIVVMRLRGDGAFLLGDRRTDLFLVLGGAVTVAPLVLFAAAAQRIRLADVGFLQYIAPTMVFLIAVLYFRDPLQPDRLVGFILVWVALAVYTISIVRARRSARALKGVDS